MVPRVFLFQHVAYVGGVWQATCSLIKALDQISRERGQLRLSLGVAQDQSGVEELAMACPDLPIERMETRIARGYHLRRKYPGVASSLRCFTKYCYFTPHRLALDSDLWVALVDRFRRPLAPIRPYGVLIHDMIHLHTPESFNRSFLKKDIPRGLTPTIRRAQFQITTTPATASDVRAAYGTAESAMHVLPVAHEPHQRFARIEPTALPGLTGPFILNVANASPHKGAKVLLRGFARWQAQSPNLRSRLVLCGWGTDAFLQRAPISKQQYCNEIRELVNELGLQESQVFFCGHIDDPTLKYLFEHASVVVNAASFDNGSYSMIEAAWFGRPLVCSDYPAAKYIDTRFQLNAHLFKNGDPQSLADKLALAMNSEVHSGAALSTVRSQLAHDELSLRTYAERFYETLVSQVSRAV